MKILIISTCNENLHENEFVRPITDIIKMLKISYEIQHYSNLKNIESYDKIIICGTALKDNEYQQINFSWIKNIDKHILGICAGAQVIAREFDAKIIENQEIGFVKLEIIKQDEILENVELNEVYALHNYGFECPNKFEIIAKTKTPHIIKNNKIYGILFHVEARNKNIIKNFIKNV